MKLPEREFLAKLSIGQVCCSRWRKPDSEVRMSDEEVEYELSNSPSEISWIGHIVSFGLNSHGELLVKVHTVTPYSATKIVRSVHFSQIYIIGKI